jgi:Tfp pilus assembly protein PilV
MKNLTNSFVRNNKNKTYRGFNLIESMVFLFIFSLISLVFLQVYSVGTRIIIDSKNRLGAVALANQKMEIVRSIEYDDIGTKSWNGSAWVYGVPAGDLLQQETVAVNTRSFTVNTFAQYVDDSFDGTTSSSPADTIPTDYKKVRIEVSWGAAASEKVVLFANFSPEGIETAVAGGTLAINVLKADGTGVENTSVSVVNSTLSLNINGVTDSTGNLTLPGMPAASQSYVVTVSKSGHYGATTFSPYPTTSYTPVNIHASVVVNTLNQFSIIMDQSVSIPINTVDPFDQDIPTIEFSLSGGRLLGTHPTTGVQTVTLNDNSRTTDSSGEYNYTSQSYGLYTIALGPSSTTKYELYKVLPQATSSNDSFDITPGSTTPFKVVLLDKEIGSLKVSVTDSAAGLPISGASVRVENATLLYDTSGTTDQFGWVYFPQNSYNITVSATGYQNETDTATLSGVLVNKVLQMTAN